MESDIDTNLALGSRAVHLVCPFNTKKETDMAASIGTLNSTAAMAKAALTTKSY